VPISAAATFTFTVDDGSYHATVNLTVPASSTGVSICTPLPVFSGIPAGQATITEQAPPGWTLASIDVFPPADQVSTDLGTKTAVVTIVGASSSLLQTDVIFTNTPPSSAPAAGTVHQPTSQVKGVQSKPKTRTITKTKTKVRYITRYRTKVKTVVRYVTKVRVRHVTKVKQVVKVRTVVHHKVVTTPKVRTVTVVRYVTKTQVRHKTIVSTVAGYHYVRHPTTGRFAAPLSPPAPHAALPPVEARLSIARLHIRWAPVWARDFVAAADGSLRYDLVPAYGVTRFAASARLGQVGLTLMSGHDDIYGSIFRYLGRMKRGDVITVTQGGHTYHYVVRSVQTVTPENVSMLNATRTVPTLALISCTPYWVDTHRVVVIAEMQ
jgi:LPXTG-site transpeptidase (sortase) family protein